MQDTQDYDDKCDESHSEKGYWANRKELANTLPFFLRAWWLRDFLESSDIEFGWSDGGTVPMFCTHTDPICDTANMDSY